MYEIYLTILLLNLKYSQRKLFLLILKQSKSINVVGSKINLKKVPGSHNRAERTDPRNDRKTFPKAFPNQRNKLRIIQWYDSKSLYDAADVSVER